MSTALTVANNKQNKASTLDLDPEPGSKRLLGESVHPGSSKLIKSEAVARKEDVVDPEQGDIWPVYVTPKASSISSSSSSQSTLALGAGDDELVYAGHTGANALSDFPHARENCAVHKFQTGNFVRTCVNCYCYVCDAPASTCTQWTIHCEATHRSAIWRDRRAAAARMKNAPATASSSKTAPLESYQNASVNPSRLILGHVATGTSRAQQILKAVEQVYPVEAPDPPGWQAGVVLRPYQRQSLAFMIDLEERIDKRDPEAGRGGWLCDEMGMGKTAVCAALILARKAPPTDPKCLKATLVITNATLTKQWISELRKFAPGNTFHPHICLLYIDLMRNFCFIKS